ILADYFSPILPVVQQFKRQDYSELNSPAPTLEFLPQFDKLDLAIAQCHSIAPSDEALGQMLFSSTSNIALSISYSNKLEDESLNVGQFVDESEQPFSSFYLPVLAPLESASSDSLTTSLSARPKVQVFATEQSNSNWTLRTLVITFLVAIIFLASIIGFLTARIDTLNPTSSASIPPQLVTPSTQASQATQRAVPQSVSSPPDNEPSTAISSNAISATPVQDSTPQLEGVVQQTSRYSFPIDTCGDRDPGGTNTWYPVYVNYSERNLSLIQSHYCRDAIRKYREDMGLYSIQVASFLNQSDAQEFAALLKSEIGNGKVGAPSTHNFDTPVPVPPNPSEQRSSYSFPANTCGDHNPGGMNIWYPVYVNYSERNLSLIKGHYCHDAIRNYRENLRLHSIQVASFLSQADAQEFAAFMRHEIGSGEVGESKRY
ncbi:MAG TPA: hypothetical protein V6C65_02825, partial [Allocoleopsis sp.]